MWCVLFVYKKGEGSEEEEVVVGEVLSMIETALSAHPSALRPMTEPLDRVITARIGRGAMATRETAARCLVRI